MPDTAVPKLHDDEVDITTPLVESLIAQQFPQWTGLPVTPVAASGTDNVTFRLGADFAVRLPRTAATRGQVERDLLWLPRLSPALPLAVPEPLALGQPTDAYPFTWGVYRWLAGEPYRVDRVADPVEAARDLAHFVQRLQAADTTGAPRPDADPFSRGTPLGPRDELFRAALDELRDEFDTGLVLECWEGALAVGPWTGEPRWIHGDLMAGNVLVADGRLSAVIDFGTARAADPAGDVMAAWFLFDGDARRAYREALAVDRATWIRALGWVLSLRLIALPYYRQRLPADQTRDAPARINALVAELAAQL